MKLVYHKGTILAYGNYAIPNTKWDERAGCYRSPAIFYRDIIEYLKSSSIPYKDNVLDLISSPHFTSNIKLRPYQKEAVKRWLLQRKGIIVLPTGSGKTIVAIKIIEEINASTFIVVPTLNLVSQWKEKLEKAFGIEIGEYTGQKKDLKSITVSTYNSAYINAENLGNKFMLLIFDEVHHLPAEGYKQIAEMFASPYRLGLTATYEREDGLHEELKRLIGGKVYERKVEHLAGKYLADYEMIRISVDLTEEERKEYEKYYNIFRDYIISKGIEMRSPKDFEKIVVLSGRDKRAREAILARNKAEKIAYNSLNKIEKIRELLSRDNRTIIFTRYNDMVYEISKKFLIPYITYRTPDEERREILQKFKDGIYPAIVSSQVLDEGIDVPEANVGIIVSGTGSSREFIQRLGRLLRPREGKKAVLYELITKGTKEVRTSYRRKSNVAP